MKKFTSMLLGTFLLSGTAFASDNAPIGVVNFSTCITDSKAGKKEQENMENVRNQLTSAMEEKQKELKELMAKLEDAEFVDSLSPKAEEELKIRCQALEEDLGRYQNQYYQVLQHTQYQLIQKMSGSIAKAAETIAKQKKLDYVINKEACFYIRSDLDVTSSVILEMDKAFDLQNKNQNISDNEEESLDLDFDAIDQTTQAG